MSNTAFHYLYRDASNYKEGTVVVFAGPASEDEIATIMGALDEGEFFIPSQVGLPDLQRSFPGGEVYEDDHVWHELLREDISPTEQAPTVAESFSEFAARFAGISWDVEAAMIRNCLGEGDHDPAPGESEGAGRPGVPAPSRRASLRDALGGQGR